MKISYLALILYAVLQAAAIGDSRSDFVKYCSNAEAVYVTGEKYIEVLKANTLKAGVKIYPEKHSPPSLVIRNKVSKGIPLSAKFAIGKDFFIVGRQGATPPLSNFWYCISKVKLMELLRGEIQADQIEQIFFIRTSKQLLPYLKKR